MDTNLAYLTNTYGTNPAIVELKAAKRPSKSANLVPAFESLETSRGCRSASRIISTLEIEILHDLLHGGIARDPTEVKKGNVTTATTTTTTATSMAREFDLVVNGQRVGWWQLHNPELDPAPVKPS